MMMITNQKKQFFWNKFQKNLLFLLFAFVFTACSEKSPFKIKSIKTKTGWGYAIACKNRVVIKQSIIPVINKTKSFTTEEDALKTGNLVIEKLNNNLTPTVTKNDLILLNIKL